MDQEEVSVHRTRHAFLVAWMVAAGVCVLALFVTGALMSLDRPVNDLLLTIHKMAPFLAAFSMVVTIDLLAGKKL